MCSFVLWFCRTWNEIPPTCLKEPKIEEQGEGRIEVLYSNDHARRGNWSVPVSCCVALFLDHHYRYLLTEGTGNSMGSKKVRSTIRKFAIFDQIIREICYYFHRLYGVWGSMFSCSITCFLKCFFGLVLANFKEFCRIYCLFELGFSRMIMLSWLAFYNTHTYIYIHIHTHIQWYKYIYYLVIILFIGILFHLQQSLPLETHYKLTGKYC